MKSRRLKTHPVYTTRSGRTGSAGRPFYVRFIVGAVVLAAVVAAAGLFGQWALREGWFEGIDAYRIEADPDRPWTSFVAAVTWFGDTTGVVLATLVFTVVLLLTKNYRGTGALLASVLSAAFVNDFIKDWVARERPLHTGIVEAGGYSYLSGHAFVGVATYGLFFYLLVRRTENLWLRVLFGAAGIAYLALAGYSRIYLGVHYVSDVIGGYILGIIWAITWISVFRPAGARRDRR